MSTFQVTGDELLVLHDGAAARLRDLEERYDTQQAALEHIDGLADRGPLASLDDPAFEKASEPVLAIAHLAGPSWLGRATEAALALSRECDPDERSAGLRLLVARLRDAATR